MHAAECSIWSGSTLFATHPVPFTGSKIDLFKDKYGKELGCPITKGIYVRSSEAIQMKLSDPLEEQFLEV